MKRFAKWLSLILLVLACLAAAAITFTIGWRPFIGPRVRPLTARTFERTPQRLERGRYIATARSGCIWCHSPHTWDAPGAPIVPGKEGAGELWPAPGMPGRIVAPNLTPDPETGIGPWTDDQLARAIREGISHDGRALFPIMPYVLFRRMSDEDLASVVVYLRSIPPVRNSLPSTEVIFPVRYLINGVPQPVISPVPDLAPNSDPVTHGAYLVNMAGCGECHTPQDKGRQFPGMDFAGGSVFLGLGPFLPTVASANITPDPSGISYYDEALFLEVMRTGTVKARQLSPVMPFNVYKNLTDDDLKAIFAYLRTMKPVRHRVDNSEPPTYCKLCRQKHGAGYSN